MCERRRSREEPLGSDYTFPLSPWHRSGVGSEGVKLSLGNRKEEKVLSCCFNFRLSF